jgi:hypothetical protein
MLDAVMNEIIDELNPLYKPVTDEECISMQEDHGIYQRVFKHKHGPEFLLKWTTWYGTPETVRTIFHPVEEL